MHGEVLADGPNHGGLDQDDQAAHVADEVAGRLRAQVIVLREEEAHARLQHCLAQADQHLHTPKLRRCSTDCPRMLVLWAPLKSAVAAQPRRQLSVRGRPLAVTRS